MRKAELFRRYVVFTMALFVSALGVSVITRSCLGTSPISSIPFVLSLNTALTMGTYIFILNMILITGQMLMLGKSGIANRRMDLIMQIPVSVIFGLFIDLTMAMIGDSLPSQYGWHIVSLIIGCAILALGICLEVVADVTMVSGEYFVQIASKRFKKEFGTVKITFDVSLVILATIFSLFLSGEIQGLREGTVIAALITGPFVKFFAPHLKFIQRWEIQNTTQKDTLSSEPQPSTTYPIITISREYGSGGHIIGRQIAKNLGIKFYDRNLISLVAKESGLSENVINEKEQHLSSGLLYQMITTDYEAPLEKSLSPDDALFVAQSRVIRRLANEGPCVIVGRCADYILHDIPGCIHVFLHADMPHKIERAVSEYGISRESAATKINEINKARDVHYHYFTDRYWGDMRNYTLTCNTATMSDAQICSIVQSIYADIK